MTRPGIQASEVRAFPASRASSSDVASQCLRLVLAVHGRPTDARRIQRDFGTAGVVDSVALVRAAREFGCKSKLLRIRPERLSTLPTPCVVEGVDGGFFVLAERVAESALRIRLAQGALGQHHADVSAQLQREQVQANESVARLKIDLQSALKLRRETTIRAPITGTVHNLSVHTIGGVVSAGQALLEIVPADSRLIGLAHVKHEDVGFVSKTHSVEIKLAGFPFTKYGAINGRIEQIAADALVHERLGSVYPIKVGLAREHLHVDGRVVPLTPGMQLTAEVKTGERTILEFILEPVLRGLSEALRER